MSVVKDTGGGIALTWRTSLGTVGKQWGWIQIETTSYLRGRDFTPKCSHVLSVVGGKSPTERRKFVDWGTQKFTWNLRKDPWKIKMRLLAIL